MIGEIRPFNSFGDDAVRFGGGPLSGYLAGKERGGCYVCALEDEWAKTFGVKHTIACNSATSGLLAAAFAVGLGPGDQFVCPAMTMSATAAAPMFTGAMPVFCDVSDFDFAMGARGLWAADWRGIKAAFVTNLFGHPAPLTFLRDEADCNGFCLIEDNAQSPFAMEDGEFAGTIGHIGVFSLNVHKPLQCGEGGMIVTDDDALADKMRAFINHGEVGGGAIGLNLRMTEVCAAIALVQLGRAKEIIASRIEQAEAILAAIGDIPGLRPPVVREGCQHVYYTIPFLLKENAKLDRLFFCSALAAQGVPTVTGYVPPLYRLPAFSAYARPCPVAEDLHDRRLFYIENCRYSFTPEQIKGIGEAFKRAAEKVL